MNTLKGWAIPFIAWLILKPLSLTWRFKYLLDKVSCPPIPVPDRPYCLGVWHEWALVCISRYPDQRTVALASKSASGQAASKLLRLMGFRTINGSQSRPGKDKGGREARAGIVAELVQGGSVAFTVDGSVGPRRKCKPGIIDVARRSGAIVLPVQFTASSFWTLRTWDKMKIPKPFAKIEMRYCAPFTVPKDVEGEAFEREVQKLENVLNSEY